MSVVPLRPSTGRELPSWIDYFCEYTSDIQSPEAFRKWSAICAVAGALERKVFLISQGSPIYPNLYVFLVGPPGSGKTRAVEECEQLWRVLPDHKLAQTSLTKASLIDALKEAERVVLGHPELGTFNSLLIAAKELGALLPGYDSDFMNALTYLYDCIRYSEKRRTKDTDFIIEKPQLNLIACTTPSFLTDTMHEGAWDQGFLSRVIIIYSGVTDIAPLNLLGDGPKRDPHLAAALKKDMQAIGAQIGRLQFDSREPTLMLEAWNQDRAKSEPKHPRLVNYNTRRIVNLLKLCQIATVDRGGAAIGAQDVHRAQEWITEAELKMADVFLAMSSGGDARVINESHHWMVVQQVRANKATSGAELRQYLFGRVPSHSVEKIIQMMLSTGMIKVTGPDDYWAKPPT